MVRLWNHDRSRACRTPRILSSANARASGWSPCAPAVPRGLSLKAYAGQQGLNLQRFYHWHRRLKRLGLVATDTLVSFAAVRVSASAGVTGTQRLHFPNGLMLEWDGSADLALVEQLLRLSQASS